MNCRIKASISNYILEKFKEDDRDIQKEIDNITHLFQELEWTLYNTKQKYNEYMNYYVLTDDQTFFSESTEIEIELDEDDLSIMDTVIEECIFDHDLGTLLWVELIEDLINKLMEKAPSKKYPFIYESNDRSNVISHCLWRTLLKEQLEWEDNNGA